MPPAETWLPLVELALAEDIGPGDATTRAVLAPGREGGAVIEAREPLVVCGLAVAAEVFEQIDPELSFHPVAHDGERAGPDDLLAEIDGDLASLMAGERAALNFMMRLCGIATLTRRYVEAVADTGARIVDTRKTLPGWRSLDKYAAAVGGATNHRVGLFDGILIKDNHIAAAGGLEPAIKAALASASDNLRIQVEVESEADAKLAVDAGIDFLLLDNCTPDELASIVASVGDRALLEASGGITLDNVRAVAESGVQRISIGALTHSAVGADIAMEMDSGAEDHGGARA
jgi:nicotinate-nucleotide pyrophosphorylase (carboxylating)